MLVKKGVLATTRPARFQRVQVMEATVSNQWRIGLPNGVSVAFVGEVDAGALFWGERTGSSLLRSKVSNPVQTCTH